MHNAESTIQRHNVHDYLVIVQFIAYFIQCFIDDLSVKLLQAKCGCTINGRNVNHLLYADDSVLLAPFPQALQKLLIICEQNATENELTYNVKNTKYVCFISKKLGEMYIPNVYMNFIQKFG